MISDFYVSQEKDNLGIEFVVKFYKGQGLPQGPEQEDRYMGGRQAEICEQAG